MTIQHLESRANKAHDAVAEGDVRRRDGDLDRAIEAYLRAAAEAEVPDAGLCVRLARAYERAGEAAEALRWAVSVVDAGHDFTTWQAAAAVADRARHAGAGQPRRTAKLAVLGSYTTSHLVPLIRLAGLRLGVALETYECGYAQYQQDIIDPSSRLYAFSPDFVQVAVHAGEVRLPSFSHSPREDVEAEASRWTDLWRAIETHSGASVIQNSFVIPPEAPMGHLGARLAGSRHSMFASLNARLGEIAGDRVAIVDCERLASWIGKERWFDARYWHMAKQAVAPGAQPLLAQHTASVVAALLGLSRKCLVLDLDHTLWGSIIGEDGLCGIKLGDGVEGEAFIAFQEYLIELKNRGVILAVCSKNNEQDAREPFEKHPDMRLSLDDFAVFSANWRSKPEQIQAIAETLNIGLDAMVFVDDNRVEREAVRQLLPEVEVIPMPTDPCHYVRAIAQSVLFETSSFTAEDAQRTEQYRARADVNSRLSNVDSLEDFYRSLEMRTQVTAFNDLDLPRIGQLIGKTNQFNLTTRRHGLAQLRDFMDDPGCVHLSLRLRDRFADHGLVGVIIALQRDDTLDIDTWLMSCRVIGRTAEAEMLKHLTREGVRRGCRYIRGTYAPTAKNALVKDVFAQFGFDLVESTVDVSTWRYDLREQGPIESPFIESGSPEELYAAA